MTNKSMIFSRPGRQNDHPPQGRTLKKEPSPPSAPIALGILRSLDPPRADINSSNSINPEEHYASVERYTQSDHGYRDFNRDHVEKKEKRRFWNRDKDKEKEKEKERERERERERENARERDGTGDRGRDSRRDEDPLGELTRCIGEMKRLSLSLKSVN